MAVCVLSGSACALPILRTCGHCGLSCPFCCVVLLVTNVYARVCLCVCGLVVVVVVVVLLPDEDLMSFPFCWVGDGP